MLFYVFLGSSTQLLLMSDFLCVKVDYYWSFACFLSCRSDDRKAKHKQKRFKADNLYFPLALRNMAADKSGKQ